MDASTAYPRLLESAGRRAVPALVRSLGVDRRVAAEAFGAAGGLVLAGLARHQRRRPAVPGAAQAVLDKYARPADVDAADLAIASHLARPDLDPRLGGLLGDAAGRAAGWLAARTGARPDLLARAMAACAPIALGALHRSVSRDDLPTLLASIASDVLDAPDRLLGRGPVADAFRGGRRAGGTVLDRFLRR